MTGSFNGLLNRACSVPSCWWYLLDRGEFPELGRSVIIHHGAAGGAGGIVWMLFLTPYHRERARLTGAIMCMRCCHRQLDPDRQLALSARPMDNRRAMPRWNPASRVSVRC